MKITLQNQDNLWGGREMGQTTSEFFEWLTNSDRFSKYLAWEVFEKGNITQDIVENLLSEILEKTQCEQIDITLGKIPKLIKAFDSKQTQTQSLKIQSISDLIGVNALAPNTPLEFSKDGLSIIYGNNGSGKSGYVRILKHACGAKVSEIPLSNVFNRIENQEQQCTINVFRNNQEHCLTWGIDKENMEELCGIDIYDDKCGQIYLNEENEISYEPNLLHFLTKLIGAYEKVASELKAKKNQAISKLPDLPQEFGKSKLGIWYSNLSDSVTQQTVNDNCEWTSLHEQKLQNMQKRLVEEDPEKQAEILKKRKAYVSQIKSQIEEINTKLSDHNCSILFEAKQNREIKQQVAQAAAETVFSETKLPGIGSKVWKELWEHARTYSEKYAFTGQAFPVADSEARCVLCHQPLSEEAKKLLISFEDYVQGKSEQEAKEAEKKVQDLFESFPYIPEQDKVDELLDCAAINEESVRKTVKQVFLDFYKRKSSLETATNIQGIDKIPDLNLNNKNQEGNNTPFTLLNFLEEYSTEIGNQATQFEEDAKTDNKQEIEEHVLNLRTRQWLYGNKTSIESEIERKTMIQTINVNLGLFNTASLSRKRSEIADELVTEAFKQRFRKEMTNLDANDLKVELNKSRTSKGHTYYKFCLMDCRDIKPQSVLSEGESRIVSLALFLADVTGQEHKLPFIFDDPISSLDYRFEEAVAKRLVDLAVERQVIVFTHRVTFLVLLEKYAKENGVKKKTVCLRNLGQRIGEPGCLPLNLSKVESSLNHLIDHSVPRAKKVLEQGNGDDYYIHAKQICSDFRILLERMIEKQLLSGIIERFNNEIHTKNKIHELSKIKKTDCELFDDLISEYSTYEHSQPEETPRELPLPDKITQDLEKMKAWNKEFKSRQIS